MKFFFNSPCYKPAVRQGGPIHSVSSLAEGLVRLGHEVVVAAPNLDLGKPLEMETDRDYVIKGVRVRFFEVEPTFLQRTGIPYFSKAAIYKVGNSFHRWLEAEGRDADVFHSQITFTPENRAVSKYAFKHRKVYLYSQRGNLDPVRIRIGWLKKSAFIHFREKAILRRADSLLALTEYERSTFRRFAPTTRVDVIPNGISLDFAKGSGFDTPSQIEGLLDRICDLPVFLWMSRIHYTKGADVFVESAIQSLSQGVKFHAILAGPDEVGMEMELKERVNDAGLSSFIHFIGPVSGEDRLALLNRADCFVLPTLSEGLSMVLLEAMACRCAILTSPGAYFGQIEEVGAGRVVPRDIDSFSKAINNFVLEGRGYMRDLGLQGLSLVTSRYTWDKVIEKYVNLSRELVDEKRL